MQISKEFSQNELNRYQCHLQLSEIGEAGQWRLKQARVLIVGMGGLGCPASLYLAAAGIGQLGLVDDDRVSLTNLQRQILYSTDQILTSKSEAARTRLEALNPDIHVETFPTRLTEKNALEILQSYDVILDGSDNFPTRYLISKICIQTNKPHIYGAISKFDGQVSIFSSPGPCYQCLYPAPPYPCTLSNCGEQGVLGVLPGLVGTLQATETLKWILKIGTPLQGQVLTLDTLSLKFSSFQLSRNPFCKGCQRPH